MSSVSETTRPPVATLTSAQVGLKTRPAEHTIDQRFAKGFAAGIYETNPVYFDDLHAAGIKVHPAIAFSLQWNSRHRDKPVFETDVPVLGVHAGTDLIIHRPFSVGDRVTVQGEIVSRKQIRSGVIDIDRYTMINQAGDVIAELDFNMIYRHAELSDDGQEIAAPVKRPSKPQVFLHPDSVKDIEISRGDIHRYTECSRIFAPIHTDRRVARSSGLPDIILHGSATKAIALSHIINRYFDGDPTRIRRLYGQLRGLVEPDTTISVQVERTNDVADELHVFFHVLNQDGDRAIDHGFVVGQLY